MPERSTRVPARSARTPARALATGAIAALVAGTAACAPRTDDGTLEVLASFYPLQYVVERVGGEDVDVSNLTPPAADPHGLELSPSTARSIGDADLVVYLSGLQPATDQTVAAVAPEHVVDAADAAGIGAGSDAPTDPHVWLDPVRLAAVGQAVADELARVDPQNAERYAARADDLEADLADLDDRYALTLAPCRGATLVTSHEAFGHLAQRYGLVQVGISGIDPETDPSPARLRAVREIVVRDDVSTLFFEVLASPKVTQTLADDLGVRTDVLDPLENHSAAAGDYLAVMETNLDALAGGLRCG